MQYWKPSKPSLEAFIGMSIFSHNIDENIRTRTIVLHDGCVLLHPPRDEAAWQLPGGGLEPGESLAECSRREVFEETGLRVIVGRIAFIKEWVVPTYTGALEPGEGHGFGLEIYHVAVPEEPVGPTVAELPHHQPARWVPLTEVDPLPMWPKELKVFCRRLHEGKPIEAIPTVLGQIESPWTMPTDDPFE
jgi:8-oxo-dGTP pyrophosphatase MutT (NUDIX family)